MPPRPSGWFDDPDDDAQLRYWDGVIWTEHTARKRPAAPPQDQVGGAYGAHSAPGDTSLQQDRLRRRDVRGDRAAYSAAAQSTGADATAGDPPLARWWRRAIALLVDWFLVILICLPFTAVRVQPVADALTTWSTALLQAARSGGTAPMLPPDVMEATMWVNLVQTLAYIILEVLLLTRFGATPGRLLTGIRVRMAADDVNIPFAVAFRRGVVKNASNLLSGLPLISLLASLFQLVDNLWPLRDKRNQALHDKVGDTIVVRGKPQRRKREENRSGARLS